MMYNENKATWNEINSLAKELENMDSYNNYGTYNNINSHYFGLKTNGIDRTDYKLTTY